MERGILSGLAAFRWAGWAWMATLLLLAHDELRRPAVAIGLVGAAFVITTTLTICLQRWPLWVGTDIAIVSEVATGVALLVGDGIAFGPGHAFSTSQSLGVAWPLAGVLSAGVLRGPTTGTVAGLAMAGARLAGTVVNGVSLDDITGPHALSLVSSGVLYGLAGGVSGYIANVVRRAERQVSAAQAREEMARHLHDGVLQTLTVIERRSNDPSLVKLARDQERELREYIFLLRETASSLAPALRKAARRFEEVHGGRATVVVADDIGELTPVEIEAVAGAVGEAVANAGKHAHATNLTIYAEPGDDARLFCTVKDDGAGFDVGTTDEGTGISHSIRGRLADVGGRAEISSTLGSGTEVRLWLP